VKILLACESSGMARRAFAALGHDVWSCDLLPADDGSANHFQCDVFDVIGRGWDMLIAHPPCTFLTNSAAWCFKDNPGKKMRPGVLFGAERRAAREEALKFVKALWECGIEKIGLENPQGCINTRLPQMPRPQVIHPYQFGHDASKQTCLWLKGLSPLQHTQFIAPRMVCKTCSGTSAYERAFGEGCTHCGAESGLLLPRWANQTDSGQNRLPPSEDRWKLRSETYEGIATAMADQWGRV
jgi:hypothetical protein